MRELVYLSQRKLAQFQPAGRSWPRGVTGEVSLNAPLGLGGAKIGMPVEPGERPPTLDRVLKHIEHSDRPAKWWQETGLEAGDWVHFEARLNYSTLSTLDIVSERDIDVLLFWSALPDQPDRHAQRLVLHGSPDHLVGAAAQRSPKITPMGSAPAVLGHLGRAFSTDPETSDRIGRLDTASLTTSLSVLDQRMSAETAAWMAGYARVSGAFAAEGGQHIVLASPLYVEYTSAPSVEPA